jgi:hypothetical protein
MGSDAGGVDVVAATSVTVAPPVIGPIALDGPSDVGPPPTTAVNTPIATRAPPPTAAAIILTPLLLMRVTVISSLDSKARRATLRQTSKSPS